MVPAQLIGNLSIAVVLIMEDVLEIIYNGLWLPTPPRNVRAYEGIIIIFF